MSNGKEKPATQSIDDGGFSPVGAASVPRLLVTVYHKLSEVRKVHTASSMLSLAPAMV